MMVTVEFFPQDFYFKINYVLIYFIYKLNPDIIDFDITMQRIQSPLIYLKCTIHTFKTSICTLCSASDKNKVKKVKLRDDLFKHLIEIKQKHRSRKASLFLRDNVIKGIQCCVCSS